MKFTRWWQLKYFFFSPRNLGKVSNLTSIFFKWVGWNHQLEIVWNLVHFASKLLVEVDGRGATHSHLCQHPARSMRNQHVCCWSWRNWMGPICSMPSPKSALFFPSVERSQFRHFLPQIQKLQDLGRQLKCMIIFEGFPLLLCVVWVGNITTCEEFLLQVSFQISFPSQISMTTHFGNGNFGMKKST